MGSQQSLNSQNKLGKKKKKKDGGFTFPEFKTKLQNSKIVAIKKTDQPRERLQKQTLEGIIKLFLTRVPRPFNEERTIFLTSGAGKNGYSHVKE